MTAEIPIHVLESRYRDDDDSEEEELFTVVEDSKAAVGIPVLQGGLHADQAPPKDHLDGSKDCDEGQYYDEDEYDEEDSDEDVMAALEWADMRDGEINLNWQVQVQVENAIASRVLHYKQDESTF